MFRYFHAKEFDCKCNCQQNLMVPEFIHKLDELRGRVGFPLIVNSGYRCPEYNAKVSTTGRTGPHTEGLAADLRVSREQAVILLDIALDMEFRGFGVQQKGASRFIHLDSVDRQTRTIWSY